MENKILLSAKKTNINGDEVSKRIEHYLADDHNGMRKLILEQVLMHKNVNAEMLSSILKNNGHDVSNRQAMAMLGVLSARIGVVQSTRQSYKEKYEYILKDKYINTIKDALG